jgi:hypothetical protein
MSRYNDIHSHLLYGRYGRGSRSVYLIGNHPHHTDHPIHRGGNSAPQYWDYQGWRKENPALNRYGGRRRKHGRGLPPRYKHSSRYQLGLTYVHGYTKSPNTYIGGRRRKKR